MTIGSPIETYTLTVRRNSPQGFVLEWYNDPEKTDPALEVDGTVMRVVIGHDPVVEWSTTCSGNTASYSLTAEQTDLPFDIYDGVIIQDVLTDEIPLVNLRVEVGPS